MAGSLAFPEADRLPALFTVLNPPMHVEVLLNLCL